MRRSTSGSGGRSATYYGAQREVDDQLQVLFDYLDESGLGSSTLVVVTSDHGEMGGDHWLLEKLGYWDESYHVPLIVRDPEPAADPTRGSVVSQFTESVDVLPTICAWLGLEIPLQADGWPLTPFLHETVVPDHWRSEAHFEWAFSNPATRLAEEFLGIPMSQCSLQVLRGEQTKYVQFAASDAVLPPLLYDLGQDPGQLHDLCRSGEEVERAWHSAQQLLQWRMRNDERTLSGSLLHPERGQVTAHDTWR